MITPADIKKKASRQYHAFLSAVLLRERFFPLVIKGNKGKASTPYEKLYKDIRRLLESEKKQLGYGYTVKLKTVNTRHAGEISMPDAIFFENVEDYVKYIEKEEEFLRFRKAVQLTHKKLPGLKPWMAKHPKKVLKNLSHWKPILDVASFFLSHPQPDIYSREIPDVPATFVEENQAIIGDVLDSVLPPAAIRATENTFEKRFGLKRNEPLLHLRALDESSHALPFAQIALPISTAQKLPLSASAIYIITSKLDFLRFPPRKDAYAVFMEAESIPALSGMPFLENKPLYFWSDISIAAFQQLAQLRKIFPAIQSFLMDENTLEKYAHLVENSKKTTLQHPITHLTVAEQTTLKAVLAGKMLRQKHILQEDLL